MHLPCLYQTFNVFVYMLSSSKNTWDRELSSQFPIQFQECTGIIGNTIFSLFFQTYTIMVFCFIFNNTACIYLYYISPWTKRCSTQMFFSSSYLPHVKANGVRVSALLTSDSWRCGVLASCPLAAGRGPLLRVVLQQTHQNLSGLTEPQPELWVGAVAAAVATAARWLASHPAATPLLPVCQKSSCRRTGPLIRSRTYHKGCRDVFGIVHRWAMSS